MIEQVWSEWFEWNGGERPLPDDVVTEVKFRSNQETERLGFSERWAWGHNGSGSDIIAYRYKRDKTLDDCTPDEWTRASRAARGLDVTEAEEEAFREKESKMIGEPPSKYHVCIKGVWLDVYDILQAYRRTNPADQHAIKKMLMPGQRGAKDALQDRREAIQSLERAIELESAQ